MKIKFKTFGCKLNFAETSALASQFNVSGFETVDGDEPADVVVINSCVVTDQAEKKCRSAIRKARREHPNCTLAVIGCFSQIRAEEIAKMEEVDIVAGNAEKHQLLSMLNKRTHSAGNGLYIQDIRKIRTFTPGYSSGDRTRTFLKIQDGCNHHCSFCTIPAARGRSRSATVEEIKKMISEIAAKSVKEIVLTGVNIGDFGKPHGESLWMLLKDLSSLKYPMRIRIGSVEPELLSDEIISMIANSENLMPHFHLPLQSGSDQILNLMKRKYDADLFANRVHKILSLIPDAFIACDVITGFPAESEELFAEGYRFIGQLPVSALHVFSFSERSGTPAVNLKPKVDPEIIKSRSSMLQKLSLEKQHAFYNRFVGEIKDVLFEAGNTTKHTISGFTDNYIRVTIPWHDSLVNEIHPVELLKYANNGMMVGRVYKVSNAH
jgi:threonylcarbamoyladenosine tRNA methylthiotransferase MtaB